MASHDFDVLIVGSGLAGLSAALHLAPTHRVAVITKRQLQDGSSGWAQGGIAAVLADDDSFAAHIEDTLVAGAGPVRPGRHALCGGKRARGHRLAAPAGRAFSRWRATSCTSRAKAATAHAASPM
jgi:succinate dehydrogenase/fumarate reductase flavoprotein subunit